MMMRRPTRPHVRGGATAVEFAAVLSVLILFLFSIFEYGRYVMIENVLINAVRDGNSGRQNRAAPAHKALS